MHGASGRICVADFLFSTEGEERQLRAHRVEYCVLLDLDKRRCVRRASPHVADRLGDLVLPVFTPFLRAARGLDCSR